jgi:Uma2 family endonuclease
MATVTIVDQPVLPDIWSVADLVHHLGDVPPERIRLVPQPGTATVDDVVALEAKENRLFELIDGILVEKTMGWYESHLAGLVVHILHNYLEEHPLGKALTSDGMLQILPQQVRIPDACFISWERFGGKLPAEPAPLLVPDLAVEVLSRGNTKAEMRRKLKEYFAAGVRLVWYIDPKTRSAEAFTAPDERTCVDSDGVLDGADVLPGFQLSLAALFAEADRIGPDS